MKISQNVYLAFLLLSSPAVSQAQALTVFGGDAKAQACFDNAEYVARNLPIVSRLLLEPCDFALDYGTLSLKDRAATYSNRGIILAAIEDIDGAMASYEKAMAISRETAEIFVNRGNAHFMNRDFELALNDYEYSIELGIRELHKVRYNMGMAFENIGNLVTAEQQFINALELEPGWELVENRLSRLREKMAEQLPPD